MLASDIKDRFQRDGFVFPIDAGQRRGGGYWARLEAAETAFPDLVNAKTCFSIPIWCCPSSTRFRACRR